jgi:uncharacterized protein YacL (UPF0231 family)
MRFYYNDSGNPRADTSTEDNILGWFLQGDVQSNEDTTKYLLSVVEDVRTKHEEYERWGNGVVLQLTDDKVVMWHIGVDEYKYEITLDELEEGLRGWLELITSAH